MAIMRLQRISLLLIVSFLLTGCGAFRWILGGSDHLPGEVRDISQYEEVIRSYQEESPEWTDHFPKQIPALAIDPSFYYLPRLFQGANVVQLKLGIMPGQASDAFQELDYQIPASFNLSELLSSPQIDTDPELHTCHRVFENESCQLPDNFQVVFREAEPHGGDDFIWNHGVERGIAFSEETLEIFFWFSAW